MAEELSILKVKAHRLGSIKEVRKMLKDIDYAYNSIYSFNFLVDSLANDREIRKINKEKEFHELRNYWGKSFMQKEYPYDPLFFELFWERNLNKQEPNRLNLLDLQCKLKINKIISSNQSLIINRVNIQSPGFWEFMGQLNPLQQIREYLKDEHERNKDKKFRSRQEEDLGELTIMKERTNIINQQIEILKGLGYSEVEIRQLVSSMISKPLNKLENHIAKGLIDGIENEE